MEEHEHIVVTIKEEIDTDEPTDTYIQIESQDFKVKTEDVTTLETSYIPRNDEDMEVEIKYSNLMDHCFEVKDKEEGNAASGLDVCTPVKQNKNTPDTLKRSCNQQEKSRQAGRPKKIKQGRPIASEKSRAEQCREASRRDPAAVRENNRRYAEKHKETIRAAAQRYAQKHPEVKESKNRTGSASSDVHKPNLWYYELMNFLDKKNDDKRIGVVSLVSEDEDAHREAVKRYAQKHPEAHREAVKRYAQKHPEVNRAAVKRYAQKHPEVKREAAKRYAQKHPEVNREAVKRYKERNPHIVKRSSALYYAKKQLLNNIEKQTQLDSTNVHTVSCEMPDLKKVKLEVPISFTTSDNDSEENTEKINTCRNYTHTYVCEHCLLPFESRMTLITHILQFNIYPHKKHDVSQDSNTDSLPKKRMHECKICKKQLTRLGDLKNHMKTHTGENQFKCAVCNRSFSRLNYMKRHLEKHDGKSLCRFMCEIGDCKKHFRDASALKLHLRSHTGEKPFKCNVCGKSFSRSGNMYRHVKYHVGEKSFECDICKKGFSSKHDIKRHLKTHIVRSPYKCEIYSERFPDKADRNCQRSNHAGEYPYRCDYCKIEFSEHTGNRNPMKRRRRNQQFECNLCKKRFALKSSVTRHMKGVHQNNNKPYRCDVCDKRFSLPFKLEIHHRHSRCLINWVGTVSSQP